MSNKFLLAVFKAEGRPVLHYNFTHSAVAPMAIAEAQATIDRPHGCGRDRCSSPPLAGLSAGIPMELGDGRGRPSRT
jgi:hypothetical protein